MQHKTVYAHYTLTAVDVCSTELFSTLITASAAFPKCLTMGYLWYGTRVLQAKHPGDV